MFKTLSLSLWLCLSGFFLLGSFLPSNIAEFSKLPSLINHYQHHLEEHEQISFVDFLVMHYDAESQHLNDESHDDLPLFQVVSNNFVANTQELFFWQLVVPEIKRLTVSSMRENHYAYLPSETLFQPPRF
jgi:hypothetical protein